MAGMVFAGLLLALIVTVWLILRNLDDVLHGIFGPKPQPQPRRHRPY